MDEIDETDEKANEILKRELGDKWKEMESLLTYDS